MWIRPSIPSRSTNAPKSTMLEIVPSTTSPGLSRSRIAWRISLRSSSRTARRERTTLFRERLSSITLQRSSLPRNSSRSWTRRMSTSDAGQEAADAEVEDQAALDDLDHLAVDGLAALGGGLDRLPGELEAGALLREEEAALGVLLRHHERVDLVADRDLVGRVHVPADRELGDRDDALGLVADVDEHLVLVDAHDRAVDDLALVDRRERALVVGDQLPVGAGRPDAVLGLASGVSRRVLLIGSAEYSGGFASANALEILHADHADPQRDARFWSLRTADSRRSDARSGGRASPDRGHREPRPEPDGRPLRCPPRTSSRGLDARARDTSSQGSPRRHSRRVSLPRDVPVFCQPEDERALRELGFDARPVDDGARLGRPRDPPRARRGTASAGSPRSSAP